MARMTLPYTIYSVAAFYTSHRYDVLTNTIHIEPGRTTLCRDEILARHEKEMTETWQTEKIGPKTMYRMKGDPVIRSVEIST